MSPTAQATCQAQIHHIGERWAGIAEVESATGVQTFAGRVPPGYALCLTADRSRRYTLEFVDTGARVEFTMLAGQSFTVRDNDSDLRITMDEVEVPAGGLQLVARNVRQG